MNIFEIKGSWTDGLVLDWHRLYRRDDPRRQSGDESRTELGQMVYDLKFNNDFTKVGILAMELARAIESRGYDPSIVAHIPPSRVRPRQPAEELAREVAILLCRDFIPDLFYRTGVGKQVKFLEGRDERRAVLAADLRLGNRQLDTYTKVLLVDDVISTGTSFEIAAQLLRNSGRVQEIYVVAATRGD